VLAKLFGRRDDYVLATKVFFPMGPGPNDRGPSRKHILAGIDVRAGKARYLLDTQHSQDLFPPPFQPPAAEAVVAPCRDEGRRSAADCRLSAALWAVVPMGGHRFSICTSLGFS
jgi:hypothetical protein